VGSPAYQHRCPVATGLLRGQPQHHCWCPEHVLRTGMPDSHQHMPMTFDAGTLGERTSLAGLLSCKGNPSRVWLNTLPLVCALTSGEARASLCYHLGFTMLIPQAPTVQSTLWPNLCHTDANQGMWCPSLAAHFTLHHGISNVSSSPGPRVSPSLTFPSFILSPSLHLFFTAFHGISSWPEFLRTNVQSSLIVAKKFNKTVHRHAEM
jgi:hypothetical protein